MDTLLGFDVGSSSVKAALLDARTGRLVGSATSPSTELPISAPRPGWAEQDPATWWQHVRRATGLLKRRTGFKAAHVRGIGISYQMHGLVAVDRNRKVLRPAIIWCDSRAVAAGAALAARIGPAKCRRHLLNLPGNFTASKLCWVKKNEPGLYSRIHKIMLPGDYVAMRMTGDLVTTASGLSEGMMWDFRGQQAAGFLLRAAGIPATLLPDVVPTFSLQGVLSREGAAELGLITGIPVGYRAGDQPNNALSLNVLEPGEVAVTAGTSGVVYGVTDRVVGDPESRVNVFVHVDNSERTRRHGVLLCVNGTGILNSWLKRSLAAPAGGPLQYEMMNRMAEAVPVGSEGLSILPYGNGAERTLGNRDIGASVHGWRFNTHHSGHFCRAAQEGIVFALNRGLEVMRGMGMSISAVRAGHANMFLSPLFAEAFATVVDASVELFNTDGAQGAARGAGIGVGMYSTRAEAFKGLQTLRTIRPNRSLRAAYQDAYGRWSEALGGTLGREK